MAQRNRYVGRVYGAKIKSADLLFSNCFAEIISFSGEDGVAEVASEFGTMFGVPLWERLA